jgi:effector-binding domain-containing protein
MNSGYAGGLISESSELRERKRSHDMSHEPQIQERAAQPYAAISMTVTMGSISGAVDEAFPELFGWLARSSIAPGGPPLIRYLVIDMDAELQIELAVPVSEPVAASGRIQPGTLPGGRYAALRHAGPYDGLIASNAALQRWADSHGLTFDTWETAAGTAWRSRAEHYLTDPSKEPDPAKWEVDVAYLLSTTQGRQLRRTA